MSRELSWTIDNVQGFHVPHKHSSPPVVVPQQMPQVEHLSQRHVQLSDLNKRDQVDAEKTSRYLSSPEWAWVPKYLKRQRVNKSTRSADVNSAGSGTPPRQMLSQKPANPDLDRETTDSHHNTSYASASRRMHGVNGGEPRRLQATPVHNSPTLAPHSKPLQQIDGLAFMAPSTIAPKSVSSYTKRDGRVTSRKVRISRPSVSRRSVHLTKTHSKNYQVKNEPRRVRKGSEITAFGDFMGSSPRASKGNSPLQSLPRNKSDHAGFFQQAGHISQWTFGVDRRLVHEKPSNLKLTGVIALNSEALIQREECSMCGTPNSPCTRYGDLGLWLCTACRSPKSVIEFPPGKESTLEFGERKQRLDLDETSNAERPADDAQTCEHCHTLLPPKIERDGIFCSWCCREQTNTIPKSKSSHVPARLTLLRARRFESAFSISTQGAEKEWEYFGSDTDQTGTTTPTPCESSNRNVIRVSAKQGYSQERPEAKVKPTPPLKDSAYLSKKQSDIFLHADVFTPPPSRSPLPPPRPKAKEPSPLSTWTPDRPSFCPDTPFSPPPARNPPPPPIPEPKQQPSPQLSWTPISPSFIPDTPLRTSAALGLPPTPKVPARPRRRQGRARKTSSVYPPTPKVSDFAHDFPFPPPPLPADKYALDEKGRFDSFNTEEPVPRLGTLDWERSPNRDTRFYDYWEVILGDDGKRHTLQPQ